MEGFSRNGNRIQNLSQDFRETHLSLLRNCYSRGWHLFSSQTTLYRRNDQPDGPTHMGLCPEQIPPAPTRQTDPHQPLGSWWVHERKSSLWAFTQRLSRIQRPLELSWASGGTGSSHKPHPNPQKSVFGCFFTTEEKSPNPDQRETWPACRNLDVPKSSVFKIQN